MQRLEQDSFRLRTFVDRRVRTDNRVIEQVALRRQANEFAARAETRIECQNTFLPQRILQQQLAEVGGKHAYSLGVRLLLGRGCELRFYCGLEQTFVTVLHRLLNLVGCVGVVMQPEACQFVKCFFLIATYIHTHKSFGLCTANSQQAVRTDTFERFIHRKILAVVSSLLCTLSSELLDFLGADHGCICELAPHGIA